MNIEEEIFRKSKLNTNMLIHYGFIKIKNTYKYSKKFMEMFKVEITIDEHKKIIGKIYDLNTNEEYINFRIKSQNGEFVNKIREEYKNILIDIKKHCFENLYFITEQANRISNEIINLYHNEPEFMWENFKGYGVFKNPNNKKWYSIIMNIDKSKLNKKDNGEVEIINVKLDDKKIKDLLNKKGFYPAYHMNKKNWITIILDDTLKDDQIMEYVITSHKYTEK